MSEHEVAVAEAGPLVRALARLLPGVAETEDQIPAFARRWNDQNRDALASGRPIWVVLGDSLSQGIGASGFEQTWVRRLQARLADDGAELSVVNLSRSGARIADVIDRQLPKLAMIPTAPAMVTCTVGNNDLLRSIRVDRTASALASLMAALPEGSAISTLPARGSLIGAHVNRLIRSQAPGHGLSVADVARHMRGWRGRTASDGFHPNDEGYRAWIEAFAESTRAGEGTRLGVSVS